jgi:hypothetical protein
MQESVYIRRVGREVEMGITSFFTSLPYHSKKKVT